MRLDGSIPSPLGGEKSLHSAPELVTELLHRGVAFAQAVSSLMLVGSPSTRTRAGYLPD